MTIEPRTRIVIAVAITIMLWSSAFAAIKVGLRCYSPGEVALLRFGTASAVLGVYAVATRMRLPRSGDVRRIVLAGLLGITVYHVALNYGEQTVSAGAASLIIAAAPVFTAALAAFFLGERLTVWGWVGIVVAFVGVAMIAFGEGGDGVGIEPGAALIGLAALVTSAYSIISKPLLSRYRPLEFTTYVIWAGTVPMLVWAPGLLSRMPSASLESTLAVVYLGVFPAALAYLFWSYALARMPASSLATFLYLSPVSATVIAFVWIGEVPTLLALIGGAVAIAGVVLTNTLGRRMLSS
ncbi:MAG: DMT family transporter [Coriobacteriia bacterium]|nr:DMT family transporter [Coriobacteriia bacterium]